MSEKTPLWRDLFIIVTTAILSGSVSFAVARWQLGVQQSQWLTQQSLISDKKLLDARISYLERLQRETSEFERISFVWFVAYL